MQSTASAQHFARDSAASRRLGDLLIERGLASSGDIAKALAFQQQFGGRLGSILVRLGALSEESLLPVLCLQDEEPEVSGSGAFRTGSGAVQRLTENETEAFLLLTGTPGKRTFWLQGKRVTIRRCTVSVALRKQTATLRLDCQTAYGTPQPDAAQCQQLEELCLGVVRSCWQQGTDLLHLREHSLLRTGSPDGFDPTKNACPQLQADVVFLGA